MKREIQPRTATLKPFCQKTPPQPQTLRKLFKQIQVPFQKSGYFLVWKRLQIINAVTFGVLAPSPVSKDLRFRVRLPRTGFTVCWAPTFSFLSFFKFSSFRFAKYLVFWLGVTCIIYRCLTPRISFLKQPLPSISVPCERPIHFRPTSCPAILWLI